jgi:hypothetical protein
MDLVHPYIERGIRMSIFDQGIEFTDSTFGNMLAKNWGGELWLFTMHDDDRWISHRKCTKEDLRKLAGLINETHGPVMRLNVGE